MPVTFDELVDSRKQWIEQVLKPWAQQAVLKDLQRAADEWIDIAGKVDADATLWSWAWERFPALVHDGLTGVNETHEVRVTLRDQTAIVGYPTSREIKPGFLALWCLADDGSRRSEMRGPYSIDEIASAERVETDAASK